MAGDHAYLCMLAAAHSLVLWASPTFVWDCWSLWCGLVDAFRSRKGRQSRTRTVALVARHARRLIEAGQPEPTPNEVPYACPRTRPRLLRLPGPELFPDLMVLDMALKKPERARRVYVRLAAAVTEARRRAAAIGWGLGLPVASALWLDARFGVWVYLVCLISSVTTCCVWPANRLQKLAFSTLMGRVVKSADREDELGKVCAQLVTEQCNALGLRTLGRLCATISRESARTMYSVVTPFTLMGSIAAVVRLHG